MSWAAIFQAPSSCWPLQRAMRRRLMAAVAGAFAVLAARSEAAAGPLTSAPAHVRMLTADGSLWTRDKRLHAAAERLDLASL